MQTDLQHQDDGLVAPHTARDVLGLAGLAILISIIGLLALLGIAPG